jgi:diacylglycerol kinase family enzyme
VARRWPTYEARLRLAFPDLEVYTSAAPGDAAALAERLALAGRNRIVAVGGDGTHHEVINGLFNALGAAGMDKVTYALLPLGSGNDWIRTHRVPKKIEPWIRGYQRAKLSKQNLGIISYRDANGLPKSRIFTNVVGMAYDAYVVRRSAANRFKSRLLYPLLTLAYLGAYTPPTLRLTFDGQAPIEQPFHTINVGIGRYSGGGMRLVPQADPAGPDFALTYAPALSIPMILAHGWRFYTATIGRVPGVVCTSARKVKIEAVGARNSLEIEADGEWLGYGPIEVELLPQSLTFVDFS